MGNNNLREARLVVPPHDNDGTRHWDTIEAVRHLLLEQFGGYTETRGAGAYTMPDGPKTEPVVVFDVAAPVTEDASAKLRKIAQFARHEIRQEAVYLRHPGGQVEFVK